MKKLKSNRLNRLSYRETFPTEQQKNARLQHEYNLYCEAKKDINEIPFDFEQWKTMEEDLRTY